MNSNVQSLLRGLEILDVLADAQDGKASLSDVTRLTGLSPSTVHRLLTTLVDNGYVGRDGESRSYVLGNRLLRFSPTLKRRTSALRELAHPRLEAITRQTGETSNLVVLDRTVAVYVDQVEGTHPLRMVPGVGATFPAYTSASAKAILAWQRDGRALDLIFEKAPLKPLAGQTITDRGTFARDLKATVARGYALEQDELEDGVSCIAAPIRGQDGVSIAAISVPGPTPRVLSPNAERIGNLIREQALMVSRALGYRPR
ncbi:IclR family transcriptional regulator [Paraburkholderia silviterrae]|nr:IclR family transcriptional regulator [Paraburkholderia silviterrae]